MQQPMIYGRGAPENDLPTERIHRHAFFQVLLWDMQDMKAFPANISINYPYGFALFRMWDCRDKLIHCGFRVTPENLRRAFLNRSEDIQIIEKRGEDNNMKSLKVVESGLIPVYEDKESRVLVNAREMHEFLESGRQFGDWIKDRLEKYEFIEGTDYVVFHKSVKNPQGGRPMVEYLLTVDAAKEIAMVENNERGREVRRYFIDCERRLKGLTNPVTAKETERLKQQGRRLDIMDRNSRNKQAQILKSVASEFKDVLSAESIQSIASHVTLLIAGESLIALPETERTFSATEVGEVYGISANMVGKIANAHNLKTEEYGIFVLDKAKGHNKQFPNFRYNQKGLDRIKQIVDEGLIARAADLELAEV